jgi:hypothetical protein
VPPMWHPFYLTTKLSTLHFGPWMSHYTHLGVSLHNPPVVWVERVPRQQKRERWIGRLADTKQDLHLAPPFTYKARSLDHDLQKVSGTMGPDEDHNLSMGGKRHPIAPTAHAVSFITALVAGTDHSIFHKNLQLGLGRWKSYQAT